VYKSQELYRYIYVLCVYIYVSLYINDDAKTAAQNTSSRLIWLCPKTVERPNPQWFVKILSIEIEIAILWLFPIFGHSHILKSYALFMASFNERCREIVHH
jgi:hypothetical protein